MSSQHSISLVSQLTTSIRLRKIQNLHHLSFQRCPKSRLSSSAPPVRSVEQLRLGGPTCSYVTDPHLFMPWLRVHRRVGHSRAPRAPRRIQIRDNGARALAREGGEAREVRGQDGGGLARRRGEDRGARGAGGLCLPGRESEFRESLRCASE